jgi:hypothetical protein
MLEPLGKRILERSSQARLACWRSLLWSLPLCALPVLAGAESLPASVRACASETDSLRRLVCYDREVARFTDVKPTTKHETAPATPAPTTNIAPPPSVASPPTPTTQPSATAVAATPPAQAPQESNAKDSAHFSAQVVSIEHAPNEVVLHLDNGQVWQQLQQVPGDLSLQVGDTVKIDKRLGSYWLTGPHVSGMKVRQKS